MVLRFTPLIHNCHSTTHHAIRSTFNLSKIARSRFLSDLASAAALILPPRQALMLARIIGLSNALVVEF